MNTFDVVMLLFTLMILGAVVYIPLMVLHRVVRGIARTTRNTYESFFN